MLYIYFAVQKFLLVLRRRLRVGVVSALLVGQSYLLEEITLAALVPAMKL